MTSRASFQPRLFYDFMKQKFEKRFFEKAERTEMKREKERKRPIKRTEM